MSKRRSLFGWLSIVAVLAGVFQSLRSKISRDWDAFANQFSVDHGMDEW